jgi:hypothetical protein
VPATPATQVAQPPPPSTVNTAIRPYLGTLAQNEGGRPLLLAHAQMSAPPGASTGQFFLLKWYVQMLNLVLGSVGVPDLVSIRGPGDENRPTAPPVSMAGLVRSATPAPVNSRSQPVSNNIAYSCI